MILGLIPARGGSKGIPRKNMRRLHGVPLFWRAISAAKLAGLQPVVSTEDEEIAASAKKFGADVLGRPAHLADDDTPMASVVSHALQTLFHETVVLLQPTTPFRTPARIKEALALLESTGADSVVTVSEVPAEYGPEWQFFRESLFLIPAVGSSMHYVPTRRQDLRPSYIRDGGIYAFRRATFEHYGSIYGRTCVPLVVSPEESLNINNEADWQEAERRVAESLCRAESLSRMVSA